MTDLRITNNSIGLSRREIARLVNQYIGVTGGYLGDFSYRTHADFYREYCDLDIDPYEYEGTTRERFIAILSSLVPRDQAAVVRGVIDRFPVGEGPITRTVEMRNELVQIIQHLECEALVPNDVPSITSELRRTMTVVSNREPVPPDHPVGTDGIGTTIPVDRTRRTEQLGTSNKEQGMQTIKILFLAANPRSTSRLAIDEEMRAIEQKLRASEYRDAVVCQSSWAVQPDDLLQLLNQHRPHVVHFSGHGGGSEGLSFAGGDGQERLVSTRALKAVFVTLKENIRLVVLNACYSRAQAEALVETIDCVIGMKESVYDDTATNFASSFYRAIGFGRSIQEAFEQGIASLLLEDISGEDIPELLVKDGVDAKKLVLVAAAKASVSRPTEEAGTYCIENQQMVQGQVIGDSATVHIYNAPSPAPFAAGSMYASGEAARRVMFSKIEKQMPGLLEEMRKDLAHFPLRREIVIYPRRLTYVARGNELAYHHEDHEELDDKMTILCNHKLLRDITRNDVRRFNFTEDFVDYLTQ